MSNRFQNRAKDLVNPIQNKIEDKPKEKKIKKEKQGMSILNKKKESNISRFSLNIDTELYEKLMTASMITSASVTEIISTYIEYGLKKDKIEIDKELVEKYKEVNSKRGNKTAKKT